MEKFTCQRRIRTLLYAGDKNTWILGDSGYPQEPWLMTPILNVDQGTPEDRYTKRHASARNCIERCNGVLKTRFRCILGERVLRYSPEKAGNIIIACAVLHNMCTDARLPTNNEMMDEQEVIQQERTEQQEGRNARQSLIERYFA